MNKKPMFLALLFLLFLVPFGLFLLYFFLFGYEPQNVDTDVEQTMGEGIIAEVTTETLLVVEGVSEEDIQNLTKNEVIEASTNAFVITTDEDHSTFNVLDQVRFSYDTLLESYPSQAHANDIEIIDSPE